MKKVLSIILVMVMVISFSSSVLASNSKNSNLVSRQNNFLKDLGYSEECIQSIPDKQKTFLIKKLNEDPSSVEISSTTTQVDEMKLIREILNSTDEQLISKGLSQNEINNNREFICKLQTQDNLTLSKELNRNVVEIKEIKNQIFATDSLLRASASIKNKLTLTTILYKYPKSTYPCGYQVQCSFKWSTLPLVQLEDQVVVGWGGNLATDTLSANGTYEYSDTSTTSGPAEYFESPINAGMTFIFPRAVSGQAVLVAGSASFTIFKNQKDTNVASKVIAVYGHKTVQVASVGASITVAGPTVGFSFGMGYEYSTQTSNKITY